MCEESEKSELSLGAHGSGRESGVFEFCKFDKTGSFWVFAGIGQRFELPENLRGKRDKGVWHAL
jgi:hypothetical protein